MTEWRKRLLEDSIPLKEISVESAREKHITQKHPALIHRWWARRPLAACRAAIFAALVSAPKDEKERKELHDFMKLLCTWEASNDSNIMAKAQRLIRKHYPNDPPKVLDMFAGGGAIPLEAQRLGCESYAVDLNPVAHLIELCTLVYPQKYGFGPNTQKQNNAGLRDRKCQLARDVKRYGEELLKQVSQEIANLYPEINGKTPIAYFWSRTVKCPNPSCGADVPLVRQTWLCNKKAKKAAIRLTPSSSDIGYYIEIAEGKDIDFDPTETFSTAGSIKCPFCNTGGSTEYVRIEGRAKRLGQMMLAVVETNGHGKQYRIPNEIDIKASENAKVRLTKLEHENSSKDLTLIPNEKLPPKGTLGFRVQNYGLTEWRELFNPRQLVSLCTFSKTLTKHTEHRSHKYTTGDEYSRIISLYLAITLDRLIDYSSMNCVWQGNSEAVTPTFGRQAIPMIWDYVELNPLSGSVGDWSSALKRMSQAIQYCCETVSKKGTVCLGSATDLSNFDKESFDAIITDPPYYDAVPYSYLSDFFYIWLKRSIGALIPEAFRTPLTPKSQEIIQLVNSDLSNQKKDKKFFEMEMLKALKEANRVLKPNGICTIVYAHKTTSAWETLINALLEADFILTGSWPIHTEMTTRLRARGSAALASSIFLVCQKRPEDAPIGLYSRVIRELQNNVNERLSFFWEHGIRGPDFFVSAIGPAVEVFGKYSKVVKGSGDKVEVAELLNEVRKLVTDYALKQILHGSELGDVDGSTRLYVLWRWAFGSGKVPFGDANQLCQALGVESTMLMSRGALLKKQGDSVILYGPAERLKQKKSLGEPDPTGQVPMLIDALHRSLSLSGKPLAEYLSTLNPRIRLNIWQIAQSLFDVLPDGDDEKKMLASLIVGKERTSKEADIVSGQLTMEQYFDIGGNKK